MAKGSIAKEHVVEIIKNAFGDKFICELDKKIYVWSEENGEPVQVAISLTCPKTPVSGGAASARTIVSTDGFGLDFENMPTTPATEVVNLEYTQEEKDTLNKLIAELGL